MSYSLLRPTKKNTELVPVAVTVVPLFIDRHLKHFIPDLLLRVPD